MFSILYSALNIYLKQPPDLSHEDTSLAESETALNSLAKTILVRIAKFAKYFLKQNQHFSGEIIWN